MYGRSRNPQHVGIREVGKSSPEAFSGDEDGGEERGLADAVEMSLVGTPVGNVELCRMSGNCSGGDRRTAVAAEASTIAEQTGRCRKTMVF